MMSQEQLKVNYWSLIVKLSYSVANYVITAQQSSWSQITDCCFFFVISLESLGSLLAHFTDLQVKVRDLPRCVRVVWTWSKGSGFGLRAHVQAKLGSHLSRWKLQEARDFFSSAFVFSKNWEKTRVSAAKTSSFLRVAVKRAGRKDWSVLKFSV